MMEQCQVKIGSHNTLVDLIFSHRPVLIQEIYELWTFIIKLYIIRILDKYIF